MFWWISSKMGDIVYRLSHNGEVSAYPTPDMTNVEWSAAQKSQPQNFAKASVYARLVKQRKRNKRRPFDMAVSDYHDGNDLLWKKLYGDQEKPAD